eukprot:55239-Eustigmatos_ZCMA.PRE.1
MLSFQKASEAKPGMWNRGREMICRPCILVKAHATSVPCLSACCAQYSHDRSSPSDPRVTKRASLEWLLHLTQGSTPVQ